MVIMRVQLRPGLELAADTRSGPPHLVGNGVVFTLDAGAGHQPEIDANAAIALLLMARDPNVTR